MRARHRTRTDPGHPRAGRDRRNRPRRTRQGRAAPATPAMAAGCSRRRARRQDLDTRRQPSSQAGGAPISTLFAETAAVVAPMPASATPLSGRRTGLTRSGRAACASSRSLSADADRANQSWDRCVALDAKARRVFARTVRRDDEATDVTGTLSFTGELRSPVTLQPITPGRPRPACRAGSARGGGRAPGREARSPSTAHPAPPAGKPSPASPCASSSAPARPRARPDAPRASRGVRRRSRPGVAHGPGHTHRGDAVHDAGAGPGARTAATPTRPCRRSWS